MCHGMYVEVRGQHLGIGSLLLPCVSWEWKSGHQNPLSHCTGLVSKMKSCFDDWSTGLVSQMSHLVKTLPGPGFIDEQVLRCTGRQGTGRMM